MSIPNEPRPSYSPPHGGACDFCGENKPSVYVDGFGNNTCPECDQFDTDRQMEFRKEKWYSQRKGKTQEQ